jgi:hypothetical protein
MPKPSTAVCSGILLGALCGLAIGAGAAFLHLNVRGLVVLGAALTPTISGVLLGAVVGLLLGIIVAIRPCRPN